MQILIVDGPVKLEISPATAEQVEASLRRVSGRELGSCTSRCQGHR